MVLPFAVAASDLSMSEVMNGFYAHSFVLFAVLGTVIVWRRPGHGIGWLLVLVGAFNAMATTSNEYVLFGFSDRRGFPSDELVYVICGWAWVPATAGVAMALPLLFPDGRLLSPRWRPLAVIAALVTMLLSIVDALSVEMTVPDAIMTVAYLLYGATMLACLVPLILRFHRSRDVERQQFKWVLIGLAISIPAIAIGAVWSVAGGGGALTLVPLGRQPDHDHLRGAAVPALRPRRRDQPDLPGGRTGRLHHGDVRGDRGRHRLTGRHEVTSRTSSCRSRRPPWWRWRSSRCGGGCSGWRTGWSSVAGRRRMTC